jgi:hypothetical protein
MFYGARELKARQRDCELAGAHPHNDLELVAENLSKYVAHVLVLRLRSAGARLDVPPMFYAARELTARHRDCELAAGNLSKYAAHALASRLRSAGA